MTFDGESRMLTSSTDLARPACRMGQQSIQAIRLRCLEYFELEFTRQYELDRRLRVGLVLRIERDVATRC
jgi:hypothetical protein